MKKKRKKKLGNQRKGTVGGTFVLGGVYACLGDDLGNRTTGFARAKIGQKGSIHTTKQFKLARNSGLTSNYNRKRSEIKEAIIAIATYYPTGCL